MPLAGLLDMLQSHAWRWGWSRTPPKMPIVDRTKVRPFNSEARWINHPGGRPAEYGHERQTDSSGK